MSAHAKQALRQILDEAREAFGHLVDVEEVVTHLGRKAAARLVAERAAKGEDISEHTMNDDAGTALDHLATLRLALRRIERAVLEVV